MFVVILQVKVVEITEKIIDNANYNACSSRNTAVTVLFLQNFCFNNIIKYLRVASSKFLIIYLLLSSVSALF